MLEDKTIFVLWGWYEGNDPLDAKIFGVFENEAQATEVRDSYITAGNVIAFSLYEAYLGREWLSALPGEVPRQIYFVELDGTRWRDTDMVKLRKRLRGESGPCKSYWHQESHAFFSSCPDCGRKWWKPKV